ncbi:MAG: hypothetical protein HY514_03265 [Candidatus Aenigmarchaeota archaeon]|nr:hypothetical protein [Candidatus Aenigmarchaeota archaeon]
MSHSIYIHSKLRDNLREEILPYDWKRILVIQKLTEGKGHWTLVAAVEREKYRKTRNGRFDISDICLVPEEMQNKEFEDFLREKNFEGEVHYY